MPALLLALLSTLVLAHERGQGNVTIQVQDKGTFKEVAFRFDTETDLAEEISGLPEYTLTPDTTGAQAGLLQDMILKGDGLFAHGTQPCSWNVPAAWIESGRLQLAASAECPKDADELVWKPTVTGKLKNGFQLLAKLDWQGEVTPFTVDLGSAETRLSGGKRGFVSFVAMGFGHIAAWDGLDHILFVLALVLGGAGVVDVLKSVTGFTVGHSITLALATLNLARPPARVIESAIALSIAFVAAEILLGRGRRHRWLVASLFGLVHGFGFAGALAELNLERALLLPALLGFNLGVEAGQACFVAAFFPAVWWLRRAGRGGRFALQGAAAAVLCAGSWWFIQRAFGP